MASSNSSLSASAAALAAEKENISVDPSVSVSMSSPDPTALHIALWNGNLQQILECLRTGGPEALETRDARGNRALHLALKFAHRNSVTIVRTLLDAGARVRSRDAAGWKTIHLAVASANEDAMRLLIRREKKQAPQLLQRKIDYLCPRLAQVPDFYCEVHVGVSTWIPGVSRWLPSDTVKIWKKGADIRFDMSLVGFEHGAWQRGDLSFLLLGSTGCFLCLDNEAATCTNLLAPGSELEDADVDQMVHFLMVTSIVTMDYDASNVVFEEKRGWLSAAPMARDVGRWKGTRVFDMKGVEVSLLMRSAQDPRHPPPVSSGAEASTRDTVVEMAEATAIADRFTEVVVDSKAHHTVSMELAMGEAVTWKFSTEKHDIAFGVRFLTECNGQDSVGATGDNSQEWEEVVRLQRTASHKKEQSGSFRPECPGTLVFKWDNSFSAFRPKKLRFLISPERGEADTAESKTREAHRTREEEMTFEDWFGVGIESLPATLRAMRPRHRIMIHVQPPCRTFAKPFPATVYMSDQLPLTVTEFLPVIEVLSKTTSAFESVKEFFAASLTEGFPVQFCFPLVPSVSATFRFGRMELQTPDSRLFVVPSTYHAQVEDVLSPRTHQEMLQRVTAV